MARVIALTLAMAFAGGTAVSAQYFGRNKVRYEDFTFQVLRTPHFDIYHYPEAAGAVRHAARMAERWYARLSHALGHQFRERQPLVLYASYTHFAQNTIVPGFVPEGVGGLTEHQRGRIVMPFAATLRETDHVLGHELVHAFQRDILRQSGRSIGMLPLWFLEGMAEYLSVGQVDAHTAMWLRDAAQRGELPDLEQLEDPRWFPYRYGQALWAHLAARHGEGVVARALKSRAPGGAVGRIVAATGIEAEALTRDWHAAVRERNEQDEGRMAASDASAAVAGAGASSLVVGARKNGGRLNVAPALAPDGRHVAFLSERDRYSIDVYLADAATGAVIRRLVQAASRPHLESLQFLASAGAWNARGDRFALAAIEQGQPVINVLSMPDGTLEHQIALPTLDEVFNPSWSPDGGRLVFSALAGGVSDLYVFDFESATVDKLTSDAWADLQPAWSPDGRTIAFVTDRFSSSIGTLQFGDLRLALVDVASANVTELPGVAGGKHISPQWAPDGDSLYFVADGGRRSDVHRLHVPSRTLYRVTRVDTGVTGVTALSPVLTLAARAPRMAYSVYRAGAYEIHAADLSAGEPLRTHSSRQAQATGGALQPAAFGLVDGASFDVAPYEGGLSLDRVGQPYLSAGGGAFGSFLRAGASFAFGDVLGEHSLRTAVQVGKTAADFGGQVAYVNRQSRWNWAVVGEQVGMQLRGARTSVGAAGAAGGTMARDEHRVTQIHRGVTAVAMYPFNRSERFEFGGGLHAVSFDRTSVQSVYDTRTGALMAEHHEASNGRGSLRLFQASGALVHDSAVLGPASPVLGQRYRLELAPTMGDLRFTAVTVDYRRYLMPARPFTLALRAKHTGRYGLAGHHAGLPPLVQNLRDTVRGYGVRALSQHLCRASAQAACSPLQLLGTNRVFAANAELRFPIVGALTRTVSYGPLPVEGFVFSDAAWLFGATDDGEGVENGRLGRLALRSAGAGVRINAAGFVFELATAHAFDAARGWRFALNFGPGF